MTTRTLRIVLGAEVIAFALASLTHAGLLLDGFGHPQAMIAEGVIAGVLTMGLVVTLAEPGWTRVTALAVQAFALLGTGVGIFAMVRGFGPQSDLDLAIHVVFVALLALGLWGAWRSHPPSTTTQETRT